MTAMPAEIKVFSGNSCRNLVDQLKSSGPFPANSARSAAANDI